MKTQLERWQGDFGVSYTDRNVVDWRTRVETLRRIVPADVVSAFEVGANRGHNLRALEKVLPGGSRLQGCEPSSYARAYANLYRNRVCDCSVYDIPKHRRLYECVFTSGVLIHVPPERLDEALTNIYQASKKYILAIEYHADVDTVVEYRGHDDMLWKRDYGAHYLRLFPDLRLVGSGDDIPGFDRARYWLLAK